jgi:hypothetical protein
MDTTLPGRLRRAKEVATKEIDARLQKIVHHLRNRERLGELLKVFNAEDTRGVGAKSNEFKELAEQVKYEELHTLFELVNLRDNVVRYLGVNETSGNTKKEHELKRRKTLSTIEEFKPYRIAACAVNVHKHGIKGKNHEAAAFEFDFVLLSDKNNDPTQDATQFPVCGMSCMINFGGELFDARWLIHDLVRTWEIFLRNHTNISTRDLRIFLRIEDRKLLGMSEYEMKIPDDLKAYTKEMADERRRLYL